MIDPQTYVRKPVPVKAIQVTEENMRDVARWCGGKIQTAKKRGSKPPNKYIQVQVLRAMSDRTTKAYVGDWVLFMKGSGFKVFLDNAFQESYEPQTKSYTIEEVSRDLTKVVTDFGDKLVAVTERLNGSTK